MWPGTWSVTRRFSPTGIGELRMAASRKAFVRACAQRVPAITSMAIDSSAAGGVGAQADRPGRPAH